MTGNYVIFRFGNQQVGIFTGNPPRTIEAVLKVQTQSKRFLKENRKSDWGYGNKSGLKFEAQNNFMVTRGIPPRTIEGAQRVQTSSREIPKKNRKSVTSKKHRYEDFSIGFVA